MGQRHSVTRPTYIVADTYLADGPNEKGVLRFLRTLEYHGKASSTFRRKRDYGAFMHAQLSLEAIAQ
jgi:hypothetical protein